MYIAITANTPAIPIAANFSAILIAANTPAMPIAANLSAILIAADFPAIPSAASTSAIPSFLRRDLGLRKIAPRGLRKIAIGVTGFIVQ